MVTELPLYSLLDTIRYGNRVRVEAGEEVEGGLLHERVLLALLVKEVRETGRTEKPRAYVSAWVYNVLVILWVEGGPWQQGVHIVLRLGV